MQGIKYVWFFNKYFTGHSMCTVYTVQCLQYSVYSTVFTVVQYSVYSTVFTVFTVQCLQYSVYCIFTVKFRRICERRGDVHTSQPTREVYREWGSVIHSRSYSGSWALA